METQVKAENIPSMILQELNYRMTQELTSIMSVVCRVTGQDITKNTRVREVADAVKIYSKMARKFTPYSYEQIGSLINRNHATIMHAVKWYEPLYKMDKDFRCLANACIQTINDANSKEDSPKDLEIEKIMNMLELCTTEELKKIHKSIYRNYIPTHGEKQEIIYSLL